MPAKENVLLLSESANQTILIRKDVDNLVQNIKENLKLTQYEAGVQCAGLGGARGGDDGAASTGSEP